VTWTENARNPAPTFGGIAGAAFTVLVVLFILKMARAQRGGFFEDIFMTRRRRIERRFLVYRGRHYPRKVVRVRVQRWLAALGPHKWGK